VSAWYCARHRVYRDTSNQNWECYRCHNEKIGVTSRWRHEVLTVAPDVEPQPSARATFVMTPDGLALTSVTVGTKVSIKQVGETWEIDIEAS
jgi:hypothetical protein